MYSTTEQVALVAVVALHTVAVRRALRRLRESTWGAVASVVVAALPRCTTMTQVRIIAAGQ